MDYIIYIGKRNYFDLSNADFPNMTFKTFQTVDDAMEIFGTDDNLMLLIIEDNLDDISDFIEQLHNDEVYKYMPIIILSDMQYCNMKSKNMLGDANGVFYKNKGKQSATKKDILESSRIFIEQYTKIRNRSIKLRLTQEENIKNSIQLELLHKLLSAAIWNDSEDISREKIVFPEQNCVLAVLFLEVDFMSALPENSKNVKSIIELINKAFKIATKDIYQNFGDVDKFIGNTLMAIYKNVDMAILSAVNILEEIAQRNNNLADTDEELPLKIRIGINYGHVIRGNVGLFKRSDKTIIGDTVNTAHRIKSVAEYGDILISQEAIKHSALKKLSLSSQKYKLKGKQNFVKVVSFAQNSSAKSDISEILGKAKEKYKRTHKLDNYYV